MGTGFYKTGNFARYERIKHQNDIQTLFTKGDKFSCYGAKLFVYSKDQEYNRIVFSLSRKYGISVIRNRSKRVSREVYRYVKGQLKTGYDLLLLVYPGKDDFDSRYNQFISLCIKANLLIKVP